MVICNLDMSETKLHLCDKFQMLTGKNYLDIFRLDYKEKDTVMGCQTHSD